MQIDDYKYTILFLKCLSNRYIIIHLIVIIIKQIDRSVRLDGDIIVESLRINNKDYNLHMNHTYGWPRRYKVHPVYVTFGLARFNETIIMQTKF